MHVDLIPHLGCITEKNISGRTVIVLDILRATSTIITALENLARCVIPIELPGEAEKLASKNAEYVLAGEREGIKIRGFHLGNSPLEFTQAKLKDKKVIHCTTNGTRTILLCKKADIVLIGSLLNRAACLDYAIEMDKDIVLVCAGRKNGPAREDSVSAGAFIEYLRQKAPDCSVSTLAMESYYLYRSIGKNLHDVFYKSPSGQNLISMGLKIDIDFCLRKDVFNMVPEFRNDEIIPLPI